MDYWFETMQDDVYLIALNGWKVEINILKNKKGKATGWDCDLIPKRLVIDKYFSKQQEEIDKLYFSMENIVQQIQNLDEENSGEEDDLFSEVRNDRGNITKKELTRRIKEIKKDNEFADELKVLQEYLKLTEKEKQIKKTIKKTETDLDKNLLDQYKRLTEEEIKTLVIEDEWIKYLHDSTNSEIQRISRTLKKRIVQLAERYQTPLPQLANNVHDLSKNVEIHLKKMGFTW